MVLPPLSVASIGGTKFEEKRIGKGSERKEKKKNVGPKSVEFFGKYTVQRPFKEGAGVEEGTRKNGALGLALGKKSPRILTHEGREAEEMEGWVPFLRGGIFRKKDKGLGVREKT